MNRKLLTVCFFACLTCHVAVADSPDSVKPTTQSLLLSETRQITFEGRRAGEGYFSADGKQMVFQSERDPANPFYQIYLTNLETGDIQRVSTGTGKTTCAWIHPDGDQVLFASTHADPQSKQKQDEELELRATGKQRRYSWDYDKAYEIYSADLPSGEAVQLTDAVGYDAEGSYSPDGKQIVFASNREAYSRELTEREAALFEVDPAFMIDLYIMNADGSDVRRLTDEPGYDGGPFFSSDGTKICWRRFSEDGATAEIYTMNSDGSGVKRLTNIGAMSWAPYFHPSGDYLIFTTNKHGFANFELYLVRADGVGEPVRVTETDGFDGLPVFLPDGDRLSWTSNRTKEKRSQIFLADWNHDKALSLLGLRDDQESESDEDRIAALANSQSSAPAFSPADVMRHVDYLTRPELGGRLTGTPGEKRATAYVAAYLESLGFEPAGQNGTFFHEFDFPAGSNLADDNSMKVGDRALELGKDYQPLSFSADGPIDSTGIVFAGYGMQIPGTDGTDEYDSYVHLNVLDQWVMVFRDLPQEIKPEVRQRMARYSSPRRKATIARDLGAKGIIFVAGPTSKVQNQLIRFDRNASQAGVSITAVSVTNAVAEKMLAGSEENLQDLQSKLDDGSMMMGFQIEGADAEAKVEIQRNRGVGRNVIARLPAAETVKMDQPVVMLGAHIDHLGVGGGSNSLARDDEREQIHVGADDNASGVAAMLEIAQYLAAEKRAGRLQAKRDFVVAGWSGEELGLFGSQSFVDSFYQLYPDAPKADVDEKAAAAAAAHGMTTESMPLTDAIAVYLNMDMVGRLREKAIIQGIGSSPGFAGEVSRRNLPVGLDLELDKTSTRLPTDASAFVSRDVPILSAFTGAHEDYHTPRDTADKLNYEGVAKIAKLFGLLTRGFMVADSAPEFKLEEGQANNDATPVARLTAYLGTIPDYVSTGGKGLKLSGVSKGGPAFKAGLLGGDVVVELAGRKVEDIHDYTYAIEALKIGEAVDVVVKRDGKEVTLKVTPTSRD
ncbi:Leupeptin-inactivating enzyme 1 precursor [Rubripirellula obstinata]|uniref:Leupeptin-inactivating enzyme 1 n=1 Tax=Rubripirellula obstinata TaxID=406547 RepID=A0A5B1CEX9_9BACT|nr:M28 family peptidase [Rubripirellula obstinata]KAA1259717.1 Leupeptin-inactivating enzyme 1 precursor [Rubripirellula obstinata]